MRRSLRLFGFMTCLLIGEAYYASPISNAAPLILDKTIQFQDDSGTKHDLKSVIRNDQLLMDSNNTILSNIATDNVIVSGDLANKVEFKNTNKDDLLGSDTILFGGSTIGKVTGHPSGIAGSSAPVTILADPYGNFNNGCVLCVSMDSGDYTFGSARAGVTGIDYRGGDPNAIVSENAVVGLYEYANNKQARFVLDVAYYTTKGIVLKTALTDTQRNLIKPGMYVSTNSDDTSIAVDQSAIDAGNIPKKRFYQSYTSHTPVSDDGLTINVVGWRAPNSSNTATGQIPHPIQSEYTANTDISSYLDTQNSNYDHPVVFLGAPNTSFGRNLFMNYDGSFKGSGAGKNDTSALANVMVGEEIDLTASNMTTDHEVHYFGLTISTPEWQCASGVSSCGATADSSAFVVNAMLNHGAIIQCGGNCIPLSGQGYWIHSDRGVQNVGTTTPSTTWEMFETDGWVDGTNRARFVTWLSKDTADTTGVGGASLHLAYQNDKGDSTGVPNGDWGSVIFNENGKNNGATSICGGTSSTGTACGLRVNYSNTVDIYGSVNLQAGHPFTFTPTDVSKGAPYLYGQYGDTLILKTTSGNPGIFSSGRITTDTLMYRTTYVFSSLPTTNVTGFKAFCSDCYSKLRESGDTHLGLEVTWDGSRWDDALGIAAQH